MGLDKCAHHFDALRIIQYTALHAVGRKKIFCAFECLVFADDDSWNFIEQCGARTHDAGTQGADQEQFVPVGSASGIADANYLGVSGGIASLDPQIVPSGDDLAFEICKDGADGDTAFR